MARRFTVEWWTGVLVLAVLGWHAAFPVVCFAADQSAGAIQANVARVERAIRCSQRNLSFRHISLFRVRLLIPGSPP